MGNGLYVLYLSFKYDLEHVAKDFLSPCCTARRPRGW